MKTNKKTSIYINKNIFTELDRRYNGGNVSIIIPNICHKDCYFTSEFSKQLCVQYPDVEKNYTILGKSFTQKNPTYVQYINITNNINIQNKNSIHVANMICDGFNKENKRINYGYLALSMYKIKQYCLDIKNKNIDGSTIEIHLAKYFTGKNTSDWKFIENLITDIWLDKFNVFIYNRISEYKVSNVNNTYN